VTKTQAVIAFFIENANKIYNGVTITKILLEYGRVMDVGLDQFDPGQDEQIAVAFAPARQNTHATASFN